MIEPTNDVVPKRWHVLMMLRFRMTQTKNAIDKQLSQSPLQLLGVIAMLVFIWVALFFFLQQVLRQVGAWNLVGIVAQMQVYRHFFFLLSVMLAFSSAILSYGNLFSKNEAGHLMVMPANAHQIIFVKWLEGLAMSSWSFMLLGVPLMLAIAIDNDVQWYFYPVFAGHFVAFVIIPATVGMLIAWAVAMYAPRRSLSVIVAVGGAMLGLVIGWVYKLSRSGVNADEWLQKALTELSFTGSKLLPSAYTASGIASAMQPTHNAMMDSLFDLCVVLANGLFLVWLAVNLVGRSWPEAFSRARQGRVQAIVTNGWFTSAICWSLFFYLPKRHRLLILKDLRGLTRDATQWTQMVIMIGLLMLYAGNLDRLPLDINQSSVQMMVAFLNLTAVSLILATFSNRFVFPLLSLESQQLWGLNLVPIRRGTILLVKFWFAMMLTGISGLAVMGLAVHVMNLPTIWTQMNIVVCLCVCVGLCGLAIGLGARFPVLGQNNPVRIASGFGGTMNLIASMIFVGIVMFGVGYLTWTEYERVHGVPDSLSTTGYLIVASIIALSLVSAVGAIWIGARHFNRLEV